MESYTDALVRENVERIEREIDRGGLCMLLEVVEMVCGEKAQHIRETWQDEALAKQWDRAATQIRRCMASKAVASL